MAENDIVAIGKITGAHGVNGAFKVAAYAESSTMFAPDLPIMTQNHEGRQACYTIAWVKPHPRGLLMAFKEVGSRDAAYALRGNDLCVHRRQLPELEDGTYYWTDLEGMRVYEEDGRFLGQVTSIIATGSNDVLVVQDHTNASTQETLIPAIASVVMDVDLDQRTIRVALPEGL